MKSKEKNQTKFPFGLFLFAMILALFVSGCGSLDRGEQYSQREEITTDAGGNTSTNTVTDTNIVYSVSPEVIQAIETARGVNEVANPTPFKGAVDTALYLTLAAFGLAAKIKSNHANKEKTRADKLASDLETAGKVAESLIIGIEKATASDTSSAVKKAVKEAAKAKGVTSQLDEKKLATVG